MKSPVWTKLPDDRRRFIGGSDARVIMGADCEALLRLWQEKRGEAQWYERTTGQVVKDVQTWVRHPVRDCAQRKSSQSSSTMSTGARASSSFAARVNYMIVCRFQGMSARLWRTTSGGTGNRLHARCSSRIGHHASPLPTLQVISEVLKDAFERTKLRPPTRYVGSHILRHSLATDMVRRGASLAEIGEVLRHRARHSTMIYAKLDVEGLRSVAREWPVAGGAK